MSNRIDKLFNDKLADHTVTPPPNAWARVEANLSKKNKAVIWFRWAAALLIPVLLVGYMLWLKKNTEPATRTDVAVAAPAKIKEIIPKAVEKEQTEQLKGARENDVLPDQSFATTRNDNDRKEQPNPSEKKPVAGHDNQSTGQSDNAVPFATPEQTAMTTHNNPVDTNPTTVQNVNMSTNDLSPTTQSTTQRIAASKNEEPIVIEYAIESPVIETEKAITLTIELKEKKGFQKVIDFVRDSKNSEGPFATIREAKDDLFAFNFKKDKPKHK